MDVILGFVIPESLKGNDFLKSLISQYIKKGSLSEKQIEYLQDILEVEVEFYDYEFYLPYCHVLLEDYQDLRAKYKRNKFKGISGKNACARALISIADGSPRTDLIDRVLGKNFVNTSFRK